ncbi:hypothetical protein BpHYR1_015545 [Brachionus plicatilis]|uniref:Uncharacterized protein n=1 Tax=Brachionus plicatilis TaxID=10195 RepID=A0A3M7Q9G5_BRAPC|nr:hypothetical protein BpHYR1_015545 [Brachionus plicatilis]
MSKSETSTASILVPIYQANHDTRIIYLDLDTKLIRSLRLFDFFQKFVRLIAKVFELSANVSILF